MQTEIGSRQAKTDFSFGPRDYHFSRPFAKKENKTELYSTVYANTVGKCFIVVVFLVFFTVVRFVLFYNTVQDRVPVDKLNA